MPTVADECELGNGRMLYRVALTVLRCGAFTVPISIFRTVHVSSSSYDRHFVLSIRHHYRSIALLYRFFLLFAFLADV